MKKEPVRMKARLSGSTQRKAGGDLDGFLSEVRKALGRILEEKGATNNFSLSKLYQEIPDVFERFKIGGKYQYRAMAFALERIIAEGKPIISDNASEKKEAYIRLFSHPGGAVSFCFIETNDLAERFRHFQGEK